MSRRAVPLLVLVLAAPACSGGVAATLAGAPPIDGATCATPKGHDRPLIVEWPSADRAALEAGVRRGVVAVRYSGCSMRLLPRCTLPGSYRYSGVTRKTDRLQIRNADQLHLDLPLGAAELEGKLARSGELTVDMTIVGELLAERLPRSRAELVGPAGECAPATHVVRAVTVGAFDFYTGAAADVSAGFHARAGSTAKRETLAQDGSAAACAAATREDSAPRDDCGALLRLDVVPLDGEPVCPDGTRWDGRACAAPVAELACPRGTRAENGACVFDATGACPPGMHFAAARGCVPDQAAPSATVGSCPAGMIFHPGGAFNVGSDDGQYESEQPAHSATVAPFCLDATEVTVAAYAACARAGACPPAGTGVMLDGVRPEYKAFADPLCNRDRPDRATHPVNCVDVYQAEAFCRTRGARLPNEQEWEFAARGGAEARPFPWGDAALAPDRLNGCGRECADFVNAHGDYTNGLYAGRDGFVTTAPVGSFPGGASRWGALDLAGNVGEWTSSVFCRYRNYGCNETRRVAKGGDFFTAHFADVRGSHRAAWNPSARMPQIGFRCAKTP